MSAEQQTMNFYNTIGNRFVEPLARGLYLEIAQIEEQHVSHYESILDPSCTMLENLTFHEYNECWIYYSFMQEETDPKVKALYELHLAMEIEHLRIACEMMRTVERRDPEAFLPKAIDCNLAFKENKAYVRQVLKDQVNLTADGPEFVPVTEIDPDHRYFAYKERVNGDWVPSEKVIAETRARRKRDYRLEIGGPNPVAGLRREEQRSGQSTDYAKVSQAA
jgi:uncharacterized C2H2 Zn-finger protein